MKRVIGMVVVSAAILGLNCWSAEPEAKAPAKATTGDKAVSKDAKKPVVIIETSMGTIKAELWPDKAPITVENFLKYVDAKFFDGTIFHRVWSGFMIQGGGFTKDMKQKETKPAIKNEAKSTVPNDRGTLAMARTDEIDSATAQFFINHVDNSRLNHADETPEGFGYCVFGKVVDGMDVVDKIAKVPVRDVGRFQKVPVETVTIKSIKRAQ